MFIEAVFTIANKKKMATICPSREYYADVKNNVMKF